MLALQQELRNYRTNLAFWVELAEKIRDAAKEIGDQRNVEIWDMQAAAFRCMLRIFDEHVEPHLKTDGGIH